MDYDLEYDIEDCPWILEKIRTRDDYAQNLYASMCNMRWIKAEVVPILKEDYWSCSWRSAGGIVAHLQRKGDYMNWYCSGMGGIATYDEPGESWEAKRYVPEGVVTDEIEKDLRKLGWIPSPWPDEKS